MIFPNILFVSVVIRRKTDRIPFIITKPSWNNLWFLFNKEVLIRSQAQLVISFVHGIVGNWLLSLLY